MVIFNFHLPTSNVLQLAEWFIKIFMQLAIHDWNFASSPFLIGGSSQALTLQQGNTTINQSSYLLGTLKKIYNGNIDFSAICNYLSIQTL